MRERVGALSGAEERAQELQVRLQASEASEQALKERVSSLEDTVRELREQTELVSVAGRRAHARAHAGTARWRPAP